MVQSRATTVSAYLKALPSDRRQALETIRTLIKQNTDDGIVEMMSYGMIGYHVPLSRYPSGYHCNPSMPLPYAGLASQKNHMSVYMMGIYVDEAEVRQFQAEWKARGKRLDMGKACIRFRKIEDVPLDVLADAFRRMPSDRYIGLYESQLVGGRPVSTRAAGKKKATAKKLAKK